MHAGHAIGSSGPCPPHEHERFTASLSASRSIPNCGPWKVTTVIDVDGGMVMTWFGGGLQLDVTLPLLIAQRQIGPVNIPPYGYSVKLPQYGHVFIFLVREAIRREAAFLCVQAKRGFRASLIRPRSFLLGKKPTYVDCPQTVFFVFSFVVGVSGDCISDETKITIEQSGRSVKKP